MQKSCESTKTTKKGKDQKTLDKFGCLENRFGAFYKRPKNAKLVSINAGIVYSGSGKIRALPF